MAYGLSYLLLLIYIYIYLFIYLYLLIYYCGLKACVPVTTAWRVLRLQIDERPPIRRVAAINLITSRGRPTRCGPPAWGLGEVLTTPPCKKLC